MYIIMNEQKFSCLLIHYSILPQLIPLAITLLEALCLISLLPSLRPLLGKKCPSYQLPFLWNNLPTNIKQISNSLKFKTTLLSS